VEILDQSELTDRAAALVEAARAAGADAADAVCVRGISLSVDMREGAMEETQRAEGDDFSLRVFVGKRSAGVSANILTNSADLAERAVAMAKAAPEDPYAGLADAAALAESFPDLDLLDATIPDVGQLVDSAKAAEEALLAVKGVAKSGGASAGWSLGGMVLATSHGFSASYLRSRFGISASAIAGEGTAMERDYDYDSRVFAGDLLDPQSIGRSAGERAVQRLNPGKMKTGRATAVFDPRVAGSLVSHLTGAINGAAVARGTSFLRDSLSEQIFAPAIRISDDPLKPRGSASRPFDGEGVGAGPLDLVRDGVLQTWLLDSATARELGLETNGRAARGGGNPSPGATNLLLHPGESSRQDLIASVDHGVLVTELIGHGVNPVTGDYSRGAAGFAIEKGEVTHPVSEITIASNLRDMFAVLQAANDLPGRYRIEAPSLAVEGMTVAGN